MEYAVKPAGKEVIDDGRGPWGERRRMHPQDILLREFGFKIHARPRDGSAWWTRGGELYSFEAALIVVQEEQERQ